MPIEPVEPRTTTRIGRAHQTSRERDDQVVDGGQAEQHRVEAVEHAAVPGQERAEVLEPEVALEHRLAQVAERGEDRDHDAEQQAVAESSPTAWRPMTARRSRP